jgi:hypothetical protein
MRRHLLRSIPFVMLAFASTTLAQEHAPSMEGKWVGMAQVTTCSASGGSIEVVLRLDDRGYSPPPHLKTALTLGNVSGPVEIDGKLDGIAALNYDPTSSTFESAIRSQRGAASVGLTQSADSAFSSYWVKLKPGSASFGVGKYQTLTGTFSRPDSHCPALQNAGQVLHGTLRKR